MTPETAESSLRTLIPMLRAAVRRNDVSGTMQLRPLVRRLLALRNRHRTSDAEGFGQAVIFPLPSSYTRAY